MFVLFIEGNLFQRPSKQQYNRTLTKWRHDNKICLHFYLRPTLFNVGGV